MSTIVRHSPLQVLREFLTWRPTRLEKETETFLICSILDFVVTAHLLLSPIFIESNPVARFFYQGFGLLGMAAFKCTVALIVVLLCEVIARKRLDVGKRVLNYGSLILSAVVGYSLILGQSQTG